MGFFNEIGKKGAEATSKIAREGKLKFKISDNKGKIKDIYQEIGRIIYEKHLREENIDIKENLKEQLSTLDELSKEIEDARLELLRLNQKKLCSNCYEEISVDVAFCPKCGAKQENQTSVKEEALEKLENAEIKEENKQEAEIVKQELEEEVIKENNDNSEN